MGVAYATRSSRRAVLSRGIFAAYQRSIALGRAKKQAEVEVD